MSNLSLINYLQSCRLCLNPFRYRETKFEITELIKSTFFLYTNLNVSKFKKKYSFLTN